MLPVERLLDLEELEQLILALFGFRVAFLEDFMHSLFPQWTSDLGGGIGIRCTVLLIDDLAVCTLDGHMNCYTMQTTLRKITKV